MSTLTETERRRETQGVLPGGEASNVPDNRITIFMMRAKAYVLHQTAWRPKIRFPSGRYKLAFAI